MDEPKDLFSLLAREALSEPEPVAGTARYIPTMDMIVYLNDLTSQPVLRRVDRNLSLYWHPSRQYYIGVKIKGFKNKFMQHHEEWGLEHEDFLPWIRILETAYSEGGVGEELLSMSEDARRSREHMYVIARSLLSAARIPAKDILEAVS